jgi:hypothetical protein
MECYIGTKIVQAEPMLDTIFEFKYSKKLKTGMSRGVRRRHSSARTGS